MSHIKQVFFSLMVPLTLIRGSLEESAFDQVAAKIKNYGNLYRIPFVQSGNFNWHYHSIQS